MDCNREYEFIAFISYKSNDERWAKWLQRKLEAYRLPSEICKKYPSLKPHLGHCFRYHTDIQPGELTSELQSKLRNSKYLLVICSPNSAKSQWVGEEVRYFYSLGRKDYIIPVIVDGIPYSDDPRTEALHAVIRELYPKHDDPKSDKEILGVNIYEDTCASSRLNKRRVIIQIISRILELSYDSLWRRDLKRQRCRRFLITLSSSAIIASFIMLWILLLPLGMTLHLFDKTPWQSLPNSRGVVAEIVISDEVKRDTLYNIPGQLTFKNLPSVYRWRPIHLKVTPLENDFHQMDTIIKWTPNAIIHLTRNELFYGHIYLKLWDMNSERILPYTSIFIAGHQFYSDDHGVVECMFRFQDQKELYNIEVPGKELIDSTLYMPCDSNALVLVK